MKIFQRTFLVITFIVAISLFLGINTPVVKATKAMTVNEIQAQIQALLTQIAQLQNELVELQGGEVEVWCHDFHLNLKYGMGGTEARSLQTALKEEGFYERTISGTFDEYTASAVVGFQEKYTSEILAFYGLKHGTGYVGTTTRAKLNKLYGCKKAVKPYIKVTSPNGGETWEVGKTYNITWSTNNLPTTAKVKITFYDNRTGNISELIANTTNTGFYSWKIPSTLDDIDNINGNNIFRINVSAPDPTGANEYVSDTSDDFFSILGAKIACTDSDGGINYNIKGTITSNNSQYSDWCSISHGSGGSRQECSGINCELVERYCDTETGGVSNKYYNCPNGCRDGACISEDKPSITVLSPNGGEQWETGETHTLKWTSETESSRIVIDILNGEEKSIDAGLPAVITNDGSISWTIPTTLTAGRHKMKIMICPNSFSDLDCANMDLKQYGYDYSNNYFMITKPIANACTDSDGGNDYFTKGYTSGGIGSTQKAEDMCGADGYLYEYSCQNNAISHVKNTCSYGCESGACKKAPSITVLSPNGGETLVMGKTYDIKWNSTGINNVMIELDAPEEGWHLVYSTPASVGKFSYTVSGISPGTSYKINIWDSTNASISDVSDNYFSIIEPANTCDDFNSAITNAWHARCGDNNYDARMDFVGENFVAGADCYIDVWDLMEFGDHANDETWCRQKSCLDTDGGKNYSAKGTITGRKAVNDATVVKKIDLCTWYPDGGPTNHLTQCSGEKCGIYEFYCDVSGVVKGQLMICDNCVDGTCVGAIGLSNLEKELASITNGINALLEKARRFFK